MLPDIDAVVISHSHEDHFCPASLMFFPSDTPIIIPNVKKPSMLCVDMAAILKSCGFTNIIEADWYSSHVVGDITLHAYPFYGEQPWLNFYSPIPGFRNQGNTFVAVSYTHLTLPTTPYV